jgi:hypothetical protein
MTKLFLAVMCISVCGCSTALVHEEYSPRKAGTVHVIAQSSMSTLAEDGAIAVMAKFCAPNGFKVTGAKNPRVDGQSHVGASRLDFECTDALGDPALAIPPTPIAHGDDFN